jgi:hypothetical protein
MAEFRTWLSAALLMCATASAAAQSANPWARGTELGVATGVAAAASDGGPMFAAAAGWDVTRWVGIEGRGSWLFQDLESRAFAVDLNGLVNLAAKRDVTPFVGFGVGFYRASFDSTAAVHPDFYRKRLENGSIARSVSFTDPSFRLSGGVDIIVKRHFTIRPEASAWIVRDGGEGIETYSVGIRVGYRFEDRPITKARGGR